MLIVTGSVQATPATLEDALSICLEHVRRSRLEPGCLLHSVHKDVEDPNRLLFLEHWSDLDALKVHFGVPECRAFAKSLRAMASEPPTLNIYEASQVTL